MANSLSAKKRVRQSETRKLYNKSIKSECNTIKKKVLDALDNNNSEEAKKFFKEFQSKIDKSAGKNIAKKNSASRNKMNLNKRIKKLDTAK